MVAKQLSWSVSIEAQELLMNADAAMYHAKGGGKNGYSFFDASMNSNARKQLQLLQDLRNALDRNEFSLHYQPKFDIASGHMVGVEALVRWQHPLRHPPGRLRAATQRRC